MTPKLPGPRVGDLYFPLLGPLKLKWHPKAANIEAVCHVCGWATFRPDEAECRERLLGHIWQQHLGAARPRSQDRMPPPGR